jgi:hypothetical protein
MSSTTSQLNESFAIVSGYYKDLLIFLYSRPSQILKLNLNFFDQRTDPIDEAMHRTGYAYRPLSQIN